MKVKLIQTGGFAGLRKEALADVDWTADECAALLDKIAIPEGQAPMVRDGLNYTVEINNQQTGINPDKTTGKYKTVIDQLRNNLAIVKA